MEVLLKKFCFTSVLAAAAMLVSLSSSVSAQGRADGTREFGVLSPGLAGQQSNVPVGARQAEAAVERAVKRFRIGVDGGLGLDPELIMFGAHGTFGPVFRRGVDFRPGIEFGVGEVTTLFGINLDVLYTLPGGTGNAWLPYIGVGPNFGLSHRGFESEADEDDDRNRFDFSDTDFEGGMNFIAGVRKRNGMFLEMKATAYGVSNIKLLVGFDF